MGDEAGWISPDGGSTAGFLLVVGAVAALLVAGTARAGRALGEPPRTRRRWTAAVGIAVVVWMAATGVASWRLEPGASPALVVGFFVGCNGVAAALAFSPFGARLARGVAPVWLVAAQALRLPLELVLHAWAEQGVIPVQMTFEGHNFDIVTGATALGLGLYALRRSPPRAAVLAVNVLGLALLGAVAAIAVLSLPLPINAYGGPPLLVAYHFPFGWIVPMCVSAALFGHLVAFRALRAPARAPAPMLEAA